MSPDQIIAELEQELRMKEKSGKEALSEDLKVKEGLSDEVKVKAVSEEEALLASPQPAAKPANILFCNWAVPDEEVKCFSSLSHFTDFLY